LNPFFALGVLVAGGLFRSTKGFFPRRIGQSGIDSARRETH
jgi:hypothetical protein